MIRQVAIGGSGLLCWLCLRLMMEESERTRRWCEYIVDEEKYSD